jgi:chromosome segregation ATPase
VALFGRRDIEPLTIEGEQQRLHAVRLAAEEELASLRRELSERVASVERKERELADALASVRRAPDAALPAGADQTLIRAQVGLSARAQELARREAEVAAREKTLAKREKEFAQRAADDPAVQLATIEERMAALKEAEKAFARTQAELATRSQELAQREAEFADREHAAIDAGGASRGELEELEHRLDRLEHETRDNSTERSFDDGLRRLERKGFHGAPPSE